MRRFYLAFPNVHTLCKQLSWSHYRTLITVENEKARQYYFEEAIKSKWSVRDLQRQRLEDIPHLARPPKGVNDDISIPTTAIANSFEGWPFGIISPRKRMFNEWQIDILRPQARHSGMERSRRGACGSAEGPLYGV